MISSPVAAAAVVLVVLAAVVVLAAAMDGSDGIPASGRSLGDSIGVSCKS
jgi:hypothetical protein